jgi:hypothetical protein
MIVDFIIIIIDWGLLSIFDPFIFINWTDQFWRPTTVKLELPTVSGPFALITH